MALIKKLIIVALVLVGLYFFYNKFIAPTMGSFFGSHDKGVDFHGESRDYEIPQ